MKKRYAIFLLTFTIPLLRASPANTPVSTEKVHLSKLRIAIDDREYIWTENAPLQEASDPVLEKPPALRAETVISFLGMTPGDVVTQEELEIKCREAELRIQDSGLAYTVSVLVAPARKEPASRTVVVSVTSGFLWRFGGGNAYGVFGKDALGGRRDSLRIFAGWNKNGASYLNYQVAGIPLALGGSMTWYGPGEYDGLSRVDGKEIKGNPKEGIATIGWLPVPDILAGVDTAFANGNSFQPFIRYRKYLISRSDRETDMVNEIGVDARAIVFPKANAENGELSAFIHERFGPRTMFAFKGSGGISSGEAGFDLRIAEDRNVRSGYTEEELYALDFALASAELRQTVFAFKIPPGFDCLVQLFSFADAAVLNRLTDNALVDAYGAGARILFDNPVFAYFTFTCGINHEGKSRFMFCGTAGF